LILKDKSGAVDGARTRKKTIQFCKIPYNPVLQYSLVQNITA